MAGDLNGRAEIRELLDRVRARWRRLMFLRGTVRAGLAVSGVLGASLALAVWTTGAPIGLAAIAIAAMASAAAAAAWGFRHARRSPTDAEVARFIEERDSSLEDRLASAVDVLGPRRGSTSLSGPMVADAGRRASTILPSSIVPGEIVRRAAIQAAGVVLLVAALAFVGRDRARQSIDALTLTLFPSAVALDVTPGHVRLQPGSPLVIEARLRGNRAPVVARVMSAAAENEDAWQATDMTADESGAFRLAFASVSASFKYRVTAGMATSSTYDVMVVRPPRVVRIDAEYSYPPALHLRPRIEEDGGDIYAPAGTQVRLRVRTDRDVSQGQLALAGGTVVGLTSLDATTLSATLEVTEDGSYRVALADGEGMKNPGDTEYFIRIMNDRPPEVRILRPARDRTVTRLEEVDIEAEAEDDFGIDRLEVVYAVRGGVERVAAVPVPPRATSVSGAATIYLEDLDVQPGDFVSYYVRARDLARGKRASVARSDIFFLEVTPFEQQFTVSQSQAQGGGGDRQLEDLVSAQKEIIVATWKLDRRAETASGAKPEQDIRSVARAEGELKTRVEQTSSSFRTSAMRDPRAGRGFQPGRGGPQPGRGGGAPPPDAPRAGQTTAEEDAMTAAALAMGKAVDALEALKTSAALPFEMEALNHLLRAQADVKERQITRQQAGAGGGGNRAGQDLSSLFDRELARQQQTNYETPTTTEQRQGDNASLLDSIKELARRQDELVKRQRDLNREQMTPEERKRELEKLTRDQSELRERAEDLAQQMQKQGSQGSQSARGSENSRGSETARGSVGTRGSQSSGSSQGSDQMRAASEDMRSAAGDLRRQDAAQASARGERALQRLRDLERQLQASAPDERRRARGDLQLEARQLADAQRQLDSDSRRAGQGEAGRDAMRRLADEQDRLAERTRALQQGVDSQAAAGGGQEQQAVAQASREFNRERVADRMQESADRMRAAGEPSGQAGQPSGASAGSSPSPTQSARSGDRGSAAAPTERDVARALDRLADRLASADGSRDGESRRMSEQLARAQELRERLDELTRELDQLNRQAQQASGSTGASGSSSETGRPGQGSPDGSPAAAAERLREEYARRLQQTRELLDELKREDGTLTQGGPGFTFEGQGMVLSAPGTEAFKQDFTTWDALRRQATQALERAESSLSQRLQAKASRDRLAAGVDDRPPAEYQQQVDSYFKALATRPR